MENKQNWDRFKEKNSEVEKKVPQHRLPKPEVNEIHY